jgi:hypothetical protein
LNKYLIGKIDELDIIITNNMLIEFIAELYKHKTIPGNIIIKGVTVIN